MPARAAFDRRGVDPRCAHLATGNFTGRCQLWAGHDGPHAVMFARATRRIVRVWHDDRCTDCRDLTRDYEALPWLLGYPVPAWQESA